MGFFSLCLICVVGFALARCAGAGAVKKLVIAGAIFSVQAGSLRGQDCPPPGKGSSREIVGGLMRRRDCGSVMQKSNSDAQKSCVGSAPASGHGTHEVACPWLPGETPVGGAGDRGRPGHSFQRRRLQNAIFVTIQAEKTPSIA